MKLSDYIKMVLSQVDNTICWKNVHFEVHLREDGTVSPTETGNKIKFKVVRGDRLNV